MKMSRRLRRWMRDNPDQSVPTMIVVGAVAVAIVMVLIGDATRDAGRTPQFAAGTTFRK